MEQLSSYAARGYSAYGNPYTFTGRRLDVLDGGDLLIMHYRNRDYSPELGRFMQEDPLGYVDGMNLYEYVRSNALIAVDPYGLRQEAAVKVSMNAYLMEKDLKYDDVYIHFNATATLDCTVDGQIEVLGTSGPQILKTNADDHDFTTIDISQLSDKVIIQWGGGATYGDAPAWEIGATAGGVIGFIVTGFNPNGAAGGAIIGTIIGSVGELFDVQGEWLFQITVQATCDCVDGNWEVQVGGSGADVAKNTNDENELYSKYEILVE